MYTLFFNYWRRASFVFLLGLLLFCYIQLPDSIAFQHNSAGRPIGFIDKQNFFYLAVALIVGLNLLFGIIKSQFSKINFKSLLPTSLWANKQDLLPDLLAGWINAMIAFINSYLVFVLLGLQSINKDPDQNLDRDYNWFMILGAVLFVAILFSIPLRILLANPPEN